MGRDGAPSTALLAGFRANGELVAVDEAALRAGRTCKLTQTVGTF